MKLNQINIKNHQQVFHPETPKTVAEDLWNYIKKILVFCRSFTFKNDSIFLSLSLRKIFSLSKKMVDIV